jgi:hypothetical protein
MFSSDKINKFYIEGLSKLHETHTEECKKLFESEVTKAEQTGLTHEQAVESVKQSQQQSWLRVLNNYHQNIKNLIVDESRQDTNNNTNSNNHQNKL